MKQIALYISTLSLQQYIEIFIKHSTSYLRTQFDSPCGNILPNGKYTDFLLTGLKEQQKSITIFTGTENMAHFLQNTTQKFTKKLLWTTGENVSNTQGTTQTPQKINFFQHTAKIKLYSLSLRFNRNRCEITK